MNNGSLYSRGRRVVARAANAFRVNDWTLNQIDPDGLRYVATVAIRVHWFFVAVLFVVLMYRPNYSSGAAWASYALLFLLMAALTGYAHYRLRSDRTITHRWILAVYTMDVFLISAAVAISHGFGDVVFHLYQGRVKWTSLQT